ncbi:Protein phosphatase 1A [Acropora cervicornis]|uniref:Protein phosphatase 1A n=1 Tax=Acropora cervicornis TaxID=6130 RepID=A0AAD9Q3H2_ACRCE|nr:Protein phosphatase 1A [Acropora cervicornis]
MGAFLEKPKTEKVTKSASGNGFRYGVASMQGWRIEMEDAHTDITALNHELQEWSFFGIFDGHAGSNASLFCAENLLGCVLSSDDFKEALKSGPSSPDLEQLKSGIKMGFFELDKTMRERPAWSNGDDKSGTTAVTAMITPKEYIFANCGDSRAILCSDKKVTFHTVDHKPSNPDEKSRIEKAGGSVMIQRVNGSLAVSRALGDFEYKMDFSIDAAEQLVSPEPEISVIPRDDEVDEFIVIGCDGIWDVMSNEEVGDYIRSRMLLSGDLELICSELLDTCLAKGSRDNMSVILITFAGAPKVSEKAISKEADLDADLEKRTAAVLQRNPGGVDLYYAMHCLSNEDIDGLPPGGGLASKQIFIQKTLDKLIEKQTEESD